MLDLFKPCFMDEKRETFNIMKSGLDDFLVSHGSEYDTVILIMDGTYEKNGAGVITPSYFKDRPCLLYTSPSPRD